MKKSRPIKRVEAGVPTGMLDAYTESPGTVQGMSDSAKFKEGYKKKGKGKVKNPPKKVEDTVEEVPDDALEEETFSEPKDDGVVDSWDQIDVEEMPVPVKVKKEMRKEEKKRKKDLEKAAKTQDSPDTNETESISPVKIDLKEDEVKDTAAITESIKNLTVDEKVVTVPLEVAAAPSEQVAETATNVPAGTKELTAEEKDKVKADREAKKAAKAAQRAAAKQKNTETPTDNSTEIQQGEARTEPVENKSPGSRPTATSVVSSSQSTEGEGEKKPTKTKAERRAIQEAQRAAKAAAQAGGSGEQKPKLESKIRVPDEIKADDKKTEKKLAKTLTNQKVPARTPAQRLIPLFSHLHQYERETSVTKDLPALGGNLHPAVVQLGLQYAQGFVTGSSERCISLLTAFRTLLSDSLPSLQPGPELYKEIDNLIKPNITFLKQCRPLSISMQNAIRYLKKEITSIEKELSLEQVRDNIVERIDDFININFDLNPKAISATANKKIKDGDVILTFSHSKLVEKILMDAAAMGKKLQVIITEARTPGLPAQSTARSLAVKLTQAGIDTTYLLLTALDLVLPEVTLVLLGCEGVMANGCVLATVGTSQTALLAKAHNKPVLVCCETYKFTTRVQTDSFVYNELSDPDDLVRTGRGSQLESWRDLPSLTLLNLVYDLTPACLVDSIITEISQIPPTSVPVVLRVHNIDSEVA